MNKAYYAVYAENGLGYFEDRERLRRALDYLRKPVIIKTDNPMEAIGLAIQGYNLLLDKFNVDTGYYLKQYMKCNWVYYRSELNGHRHQWKSQFLDIGLSEGDYQKIECPISFDYENKR